MDEAIIKSLAIDPRLAYSEFKMTCEEVAGGMLTQHYPGTGMNEFHATCTDKEYAAKGLIVRDAHGDPELDGDGAEQPAPRPRYPVKPVRPQLIGATHAQLAFFRCDAEIYTDVALANTNLRKLVLIGCGLTIREQMSTEQGGLAAKTLPEIFQFLEDEYGSPTSADMRELRASLAKKFTGTKSFPTEAAKFQITLLQLQRSGDPMSQMQQIELFEDATEAIAGIPSCIARYKRRVKIDDRRLPELIRDVSRELPQSTIKDLGYANATAKANDSLGETMKKVSDRLAQVEQSLRQQADRRGRGAGGRGGRGNTEGRGGRGRGGRGSGRGSESEVPSHYCFEHGKNRTHTGVDCYAMARDPSYTQEMKNATAHCTIDGYEGRK